MNRNIILFLICCLSVLSCNSPEARKPVKRTSGTFINKSVERNKKIYEIEKAFIMEMMQINPEYKYLASKSGFWYYYNKQDSLATQMPDMGDNVIFTYDIKKLNGDIVISQNEIGLQYYIVDQSNQELISGLRDGIKLMKEGETITFLFPSYKAFGYYGIEKKLGTNVPIQSTVTLKSINKKQKNY